MTKADLWTLIQEAMQAFGPFYQEKMRAAIEETGAGGNWFGLLLVQGSDPEPFTPERFHALYPYTALQTQIDALADLVEKGFLELVGEHAYRLTEAGRAAVNRPYEVVNVEMEKLEPLPEADMQQLIALLQRVVEATLIAPEPANKQAIAFSRATDPGVGASAATKIDQYLTELYHFRDDAHVAAWRSYKVDALAWEAFTFVWRDEANSGAELVEKLPRRGHSEEVYEAALQGLAKRGWLAEDAGTYQITEAGRNLREEAEEATNRLYFVGWAGLDDAEAAEFENLLVRLRDALQQMADTGDDS